MAVVFQIKYITSAIVIIIITGCVSIPRASSGAFQNSGSAKDDDDCDEEEKEVYV